MTEPLTLPVLALRDVVVFPHVAVPIGVGRSSSLKAIEAAAKESERMIFAVAQRDHNDKVSPENLYTIGTIARFDQLQRGLSGAHLLLHGEKRGIAVRILEKDGYLQAVVREAEEMPPLQPTDPIFLALYRELQHRAAELGQKAGLPREAVQQVLSMVDDPGRFADLVAAHLEGTVVDRQNLLEIFSVEERLRRVLVHVQKQIAVLDAQEDIKSKVQEELGGRQREMLLREQLKAIQKELGDGEGSDDIAELSEKLAALPLPPEARKEVDRELARLARTGREGMEAQVIRTYLETVAELPWGHRTDEQLDLKFAEQVLEDDHYALSDVKNRVLEFLAVRQLAAAETQRVAEATAAASPQAEDGQTGEDAPREAAPAPAAAEGGEPSSRKSPILLFVGPPGVGKTSIAKSIARAMGRKYVRISLGGARDEADIRGHRRTYVGAMPGRIIHGMKQAGTKNPVFLLDEIDKLGASFHGDPAAALLEVLDPAQNDSFVDHYLGIPFDLSEALFICTANLLQGIPGPLLDRLEVVEFSGYTEKEKLGIARQYLIPRQLHENALSVEQLELSQEAVAELITGYTREAGVRQLERELGRAARKVARKVAAGEATKVLVDAAGIRELLGRPKVHPEKAAMHDQVGVATGMYYTPVGGDIMFVEASTMKGKGELVLTGQLGDVMKESARAAWTYARSHAAALHIEEEAFSRDLHVHVPAGAIPKDGPSAGITMATAIISALSGRPACADLAMTGEVTLSGRVLPIGGVKEKVLGAVRSGIRRIILPAENERDLEDLPAEVRELLEVHAVSELGEALALTLRDATYFEGRLLFAGDRPEDVQPLSTYRH